MMKYKKGDTSFHLWIGSTNINDHFRELLESITSFQRYDLILDYIIYLSDIYIACVQGIHPSYNMNNDNNENISYVLAISSSEWLKYIECCGECIRSIILALKDNKYVYDFLIGCKHSRKDSQVNLVYGTQN